MWTQQLETKDANAQDDNESRCANTLTHSHNWICVSTHALLWTLNDLNFVWISLKKQNRELDRTHVHERRRIKTEWMLHDY